ncbi:hypothetical protein CENSYa_0988 [Cenarchaeum symbiosum A]|uniref:Uncharacterized protein n=1 Tax=Cenarchaeum symbiosum (strain A) TaxID=414004 RepID=A0RWA3_CENSY|nr:hypothetical protein CENSYa_0988 [Cenarchaeum symbiosum A]
MGLKTNLLIVAPLGAAAVLVFGVAIYNTICKNTHINLFNC